MLWLIITLAAGVTGLLLIGWLVMTYNRLVTLRQRWRNAASQIDVQLKRRHELVPNLVETVKGVMGHEAEVLRAVTEARSAASKRPDWKDAAAVRAAAGRENDLVKALAGLMVRVEAYPELKADQAAGRLMEELASTENRVAFARQAYNDSAMRYNTTRQTFPNVLVASPLGFHETPLFEIDDAAERALVRVSLGREGGEGA